MDLQCHHNILYKSTVLCNRKRCECLQFIFCLILFLEQTVETMDAELRGFLIKRNISEEFIQKLENEKVSL